MRLASPKIDVKVVLGLTFGNERKELVVKWLVEQERKKNHKVLVILSGFIPHTFNGSDTMFSSDFWISPLDIPETVILGDCNFLTSLDMKYFDTERFRKVRVENALDNPERYVDKVSELYGEVDPRGREFIERVKYLGAHRKYRGDDYDTLIYYCEGGILSDPRHGLPGVRGSFNTFPDFVQGSEVYLVTRSYLVQDKRSSSYCSRVEIEDGGPMWGYRIRKPEKEMKYSIQEFDLLQKALDRITLDNKIQDLGLHCNLVVTDLESIQDMKKNLWYSHGPLNDKGVKDSSIRNFVPKNPKRLLQIYRNNLEIPFEKLYYTEGEKCIPLE